MSMVAGTVEGGAKLPKCSCQDEEDGLLEFSWKLSGHGAEPLSGRWEGTIRNPSEQAGRSGT